MDGGSRVKFIHVPDDKPHKWDIADESWTAEQLIEFIKQNAVTTEVYLGTAETVPDESPSVAAPDEPPIPPVPEEYKKSAPVDPNVFNSAPFRCLGVNHGECFYLVRESKQVESLIKGKHSKPNLIGIAPLEWWESSFSARKGVDWDCAANALIRACQRSGIYDPKNVRGCGAWFDDGRVILHLGDMLLVNGADCNLGDIKSRFIYEATTSRRLRIRQPISTEGAAKLLGISEMLAWKRPIFARLFAGWCVLAPICGALDWRPHAWLTGQAKSGKTWVINNIARPIIGELALFVEAETTSAAIRQELRCDAIPVVFDEAEGEDMESRKRIQRMLELMRPASSEGSADILKGTSTGQAMRFKIRSMFMLGSIGVGLEQDADKSRCTVLELGRHNEFERKIMFERIRDMAADIVSKDWCAGFRSRTIELIPVIRQNAEVFGRAISRKFNDIRMGDQLGALLAGAYVLTSARAVTDEFAAMWIDEQDWDEEKKDLGGGGDEYRCVSEIMQTIVQVGDGGRKDRSIGWLVSIVAGLHDDSEYPDTDASAYVFPSPKSEVTEAEADKILRRHGIKVVEKIIHIQAGSTQLRKIFENTQWSGNRWKIIIRRIKGSGEGWARFDFSSQRSITIPLRAIMGDEEDKKGEGKTDGSD